MKERSGHRHLVSLALVVALGVGLCDAGRPQLGFALEQSPIGRPARIHEVRARSGAHSFSHSVTPGIGAVGPEGVPVARADGSPQSTVRIPPPVIDYNEYFGESVALSEDTLVIGKASSAQPAVYVAARASTGWEALQKLPGSPASGGALGRSVAVESDVIVGGAPNEARAYVWERSGAVWVLESTLSSGGIPYLGKDVAISDGFLVCGGVGGAAVFRHTEAGWVAEQSIVRGGWFGSSVDVDADSLVVGDALANTVTVFRRLGATWEEVQTLTDVGGARVALDGDTLAIGTNVSVQIFERTAHGWELQVELSPSVMTDEANAFFGSSVALSGDRLAVGAPHDDQQALASGAIYLFYRTLEGWVEDTRWAPLSQELGTDVAISSDWVAGGTHGELVAGAAYTFPIDREYLAPGGYTLTAPAAGVLRNDLGTGLSAELVSDAEYGHVVLHPDGSFSYRQATKRLGVDSFTYRVWNGQVYSAPAEVRINVVEPNVQVSTLAGVDRFETAVEVSREAFPYGAETVVLATGRNWPDALGGSALASVAEGPILLCDSTFIPDVVNEEILRLAPTEVIILGAEGALSEDIEYELEDLGIEFITRLGGEDRYDTAELLADEILWRGDWDGTVLVATGKAFPDALAASPLAFACGWPIYLADPMARPEALTDVLGEIGVTNAVVLGGEAAVTGAQFRALSEALPEPAIRLAGSNRYATAVEIAEFGASNAGMEWDGLGLAVGTNFPDGLSGGVLCGVNRRVMLLTNGDSLSPETAAFLRAHGGDIWKMWYIGGMNVIRPTVRAQVGAILRK